MKIEITEARQTDTPAIATLHIKARRLAMPYLPRLYTERETREWFATIVGDRPEVCWIARLNGKVVGYMVLDGVNLDHLYVDPDAQGQCVGSSLLKKAKSLSPNRLVLWTFQQNTRARAFYEARGFLAVASTDGRNEEGLPDVQYEWQEP
ncbi:MAG: GNAT family N-acetyltransferase [Alphaproteobacteria bacterium]|nr:GNAT family N-acetyltransferase [Alphaproteobacteria bacterium]